MLGVQVLNRRPSFGEALGTGLGAGLGQGLNRFAEHKFQQMINQKQQSSNEEAWNNILGGKASPQFIKGLASLPPEVQKSFLDRIEGLEFGIGNQNESQLGGTPLQREEMAASGQPTQPQEAMKATQPSEGLRLGPSTAERRHRETIGIQREKLNAPLLKDIEEKGVPARQTVELADNLLNLLHTEKVKTGLKGKLTPAYLQSPEGQEFLAGINQLVLLKAQLGKGVPTRLRLQLEQLSKPDVWQHPKAIENLLNKIKNDPEIARSIARAEAAESVVDESGAHSSENLRKLIDQKTHSILKNKKEQPNLPEAHLYTPDTVIEIDGVDYKLNDSGNGWEKV